MVGLGEKFAPLQHAPDIPLQIPDVGVAAAAEVGVGGGAEAHILLPHPVLQIVAGLKPDPGKVGDLVLPVSRSAQTLHRPQVEGGLSVVVGQLLSLLHALGKGGALLHRQSIAGEMFGFQRDGFLHRFPPALLALAGKAVDEVQTDVPDLRLAGGGHGGAHLLPGVGAVDVPQFPVAAGLHPHGDAIHPRSTQCFKPLFGDTVRIGLHGHFHIPGHLKFLHQHAEQLAHPFFAVPAGGAAANVNAVDRILSRQRSTFADVGQQRLLVGVHPVLPPCQRVEIAVVALAAAKGNVNVDTQSSAHIPATFLFIIIFHYILLHLKLQSCAGCGTLCAKEVRV